MWISFLQKTRPGLDEEQFPPAPDRAKWNYRSHGKPDMHALKDLFTTDVGLMSIGGIAFMLGMGVFFIRYFIKHIREDEAAAALKNNPK